MEKTMIFSKSVPQGGAIAEKNVGVETTLKETTVLGYPTNVILITPEIAEQWLATSIGNRKMSQYSIDKYARIMSRGQWKPNRCSPIGISKSGRLINGHHRLKAITKARVSVPMSVVLDADEEDFKIVDCGKKRSLADIFFLETPSIPNSVNVSGIVSRYCKLCDGKLLRLSGRAGVEASPDQYQDYLDEYYSCDNFFGDGKNLYQEAQRFAYNTNQAKESLRLITVTNLGAFVVYLTKRKGHDIDLVKRFFRILYDGDKKYPALRDLSQKINKDNHAIVGQMSMVVKQSLIAKGWNMFLSGDKAKTVNVEYNERVDFN